MRTVYVMCMCVYIALLPQLTYYQSLGKLKVNIPYSAEHVIPMMPYRKPMMM